MSEEKYFISEHMETMRKFMGWSQLELAQKLGLKQKTMSNYLANRHTIPATVWFDFCHLTNVEPSIAHESGIEIGIIAPLSLDQDISQIGNFKIPAKYADFPGASIRTIAPIKAMMINHFGAKFFKDFLKARGIDYEYTNILNAPVNSLLFTEMLECMRGHNLLKSPKELYPYLRKDQVVSKFIGKTKNTASFISKVMTISHRADINHKYELLDLNEQEVIVRFTNYSHMEKLVKEESTRDFLAHYVSGILLELVAISGHQAQSTQIIEHKKDHSQCTLKVSL